MSYIYILKVCAFYSLSATIIVMCIATTDDMKWVPIGNQDKMVQKLLIHFCFFHTNSLVFSS